MAHKQSSPVKNFMGLFYPLKSRNALWKAEFLQTGRIGCGQLRLGLEVFSLNFNCKFAIIILRSKLRKIILSNFRREI